MSSLLYEITENSFMVFTDTLSIDASTKQPCRFSSKQYVIPHLRLVIASTGMGGVMGEWFLCINEFLVVDSIDTLNDHTPECLRRIFDEVRKRGYGEETVTIYHFGYSIKEDVVKGYAYESSNNFEPRAIPYNQIGIKPSSGVDLTSELTLHKDFKLIMDQQISYQKLSSNPEPLSIGGEINATLFSKENFYLQSVIVGKFENYSLIQDQIFNKQ